MVLGVIACKAINSMIARRIKLHKIFHGKCTLLFGTILSLENIKNMENKNEKDDLQKTQIISPGAMGEEVNLKKNEVIPDKSKSATAAAMTEGLNEEKSSGNAGAFEGFENPDR